jgi:hypothetical protein
MQGKAQVKLANRAICLCDDPVGEKILLVVGGWWLVVGSFDFSQPRVDHPFGHRRKM